MISGINPQDVSFCAANTRVANPQQVAYVQQGGADVVELAGKKKGKAKKGILATIGAAIVAVGALAWGVKSGKLQKVENPTNFLGKLKNVGFNVGSKACDIATKCTDSKVGQWCKEKGTTLWNKVKGIFHKKAEQA